MQAHHYSFQTIGIKQIKAHYLFTSDDAKILHSLLPVAKTSLLQMREEFYRFIFNFEHAKLFLNNDEIIEKHQNSLERWYLSLFSGSYDTDYFHMLTGISETHVRIGLPTHYVNAAFSFVRQFLEKILIHSGHTDALSSMHKIVDINLDILSLTYKQESQQKLLQNVVLLKETVKNNAVIPYVQPIFKNKSNTISHYETLMRICDKKNHTLCSIVQMLHLSKQIHIYHDLMMQMVEKTFEAMMHLPYNFTVNISYDDIANDAFCSFLYHKLEKLPNPSRVMFEILETDMIEDYSVVSTFIEKIKVYQCKIAIDDFGAGYSNMDNILKLKPDFIKIDGSLIQNIDQSEHSIKLVENIINIGKDIHAKTIAEHVHNKAVFDTLSQMDIDYLQGFYLSEPLPLSELKENSCVTEYGRC